MQAHKTYARVQAVGAERSAAEREQEWGQLMQTVQSLPQAQAISDADIAAEIDAVRQRSLLSCG